MVFRFLLVLPVVLWAATSSGDAQTARQSSDESAQRLIGTWSSNDPRRASVKTFRPDGTYTRYSGCSGRVPWSLASTAWRGKQLW